jgi:hypothetical protein
MTRTAKPDAALILRRLKRELQAGIRLLTMSRPSERAQGQLEALRYVVNVLNTVTPGEPKPTGRRRAETATRHATAVTVGRDR